MGMSNFATMVHSKQIQLTKPTEYAILLNKWIKIERKRTFNTYLSVISSTHPKMFEDIKNNLTIRNLMKLKNSMKGLNQIPECIIQNGGAYIRAHHPGTCCLSVPTKCVIVKIQLRYTGLRNRLRMPQNFDDNGCITISSWFLCYKVGAIVCYGLTNYFLSVGSFTNNSNSSFLKWCEMDW